MPRASITALLSLSRRRGYAAAAAGAEAVQQRSTAAQVSAAKGGSSNGAASSEEIFWMRHPETGCWVPQDRFAELDAAELRARLLGGKN